MKGEMDVCLEGMLKSVRGQLPPNSFNGVNKLLTAFRPYKI